MSISVLGLIGAAAASSAMQGGNSVGTAALSNLWNKHNASRDRSQNLEKEALYNAWYLRNLYPQQQEMDYEMAKRYAENSASWDVIGLRKAGLNPILAAGGGFHGGVSPASASVNGDASSSSTSGSSTPQSPDLAESVRDIASADQMFNSARITDTERKVKQDTASSLVSSAKSKADLDKMQVKIAESTKQKIDAERAQIDANTARTLNENKKFEETHGVNSTFLHDALILGSQAKGKSNWFLEGVKKKQEAKEKASIGASSPFPARALLNPRKASSIFTH